MPVLQMSFHKQAVIAIFSQFVVQLENVGVMLGGVGSREREPTVIEAVSDCIRVGSRVKLREYGVGIRTFDIGDIRICTAVMGKTGGRPCAGWRIGRGAALVGVRQSGRTQSRDSVRNGIVPVVTIDASGLRTW